MDVELTIQLPEYSNYVLNDLDAQEKIFQVVGSNKFKYCNKILYIFNETTGLFDTDIETLYNYIKKYKQYLQLQLNEKKCITYADEQSYLTRLTTHVKTAAIDNTWYKEQMIHQLVIYYLKMGYMI